ncbi:hypothetical protein L810_1036 [Burkholderia sp. AU4i]|nr:hypothetical protein L810_1036 [Burkholderia sp. AU4i]
MKHEHSASRCVDQDRARLNRPRGRRNKGQRYSGRICQRVGSLRPACLSGGFPISRIGTHAVPVRVLTGFIVELQSPHVT